MVHRLNSYTLWHKYCPWHIIVYQCKIEMLNNAVMFVDKNKSIYNFSVRNIRCEMLRRPNTVVTCEIKFF